MIQVAEITVRPQLEHYEAVVAHLNNLIEETRTFPGCLSASIKRDPGSYEIFLTHAWASIDHLDAYIDTRATRGDFDFFATWLMDEPCFKTYSVSALPEKRNGTTA